MGGAFDPVHLGHLALAKDAFAGLDLDAVWFVPTAQSPLKDNVPGLDDVGRLELLQAALANFPDFRICKAELDRGGISYTIDTARQLIGEYPGTEFSWIIGSDQVKLLHKWREIHELAKRIRFIVVSRPGFKLVPPSPGISGLRLQIVASRLLDISSTDIRLRIAAGKSVNHLLPKPVADLIMERNYYLNL